MTRDAAIGQATDYFNSGRLQSDLAALVNYRSESQNLGAGSMLHDCLTGAILPCATNTC